MDTEPNPWGWVEIQGLSTDLLRCRYYEVREHVRQCWKAAEHPLLKNLTLDTVRYENFLIDIEAELERRGQSIKGGFNNDKKRD